MTPSDARETFIRLRDKYRKIYTAVANAHTELEREGKGHRGHGFDHDLVVAQYCLLVAPEQAEYAWIAALLHSLDRMYEKDAPAKIRELLQLVGELEDSLRDSILHAVFNHDKANDTSDGMIKIILQDADRLANSGASVIARSGQFNPTIPVLEMGHIMEKHPESTYRNPRSILDDLRGCLEWENDPKFGLRLPKSKEIGKKHFGYLRAFFAQVELQLKETGLHPWPIPE